MTPKPFIRLESWSESLRRHALEGDAGDAISRAQSGRLLLDARNATAFVHRLALIDAEAQHRLAQHRSHFNPDQPRVPAGNPDGGQWTSTGGVGIGTPLAAGGKLRLGPHLWFAVAIELARRLIQAYRSENGPWDLFGHKRGAVSFTNIDGKNIFGSNSTSPTYTSADRIAAENLRATLVKKYPKVFVSSNVGKMPNDALFHAETTVLLRAAREHGGTLAGQTLTVFGDSKTCNNCVDILPYVGLELGNPTVTFVEPNGSIRTMRDGFWMQQE